MAQIETSQHTKKMRPYCCHNCNASNCLTIQRQRINNIHSIQLWACSICGFEWEERWSSYSQCMWSLQPHTIQRPKVMAYKIC